MLGCQWLPRPPTGLRFMQPMMDHEQMLTRMKAEHGTPIEAQRDLAGNHEESRKGEGSVQVKRKVSQVRGATMVGM